MASPRIVVTSPWKLGLFVFVLVSGTGFGLIYAYLEFFGGSLDFQSTKALQNFYFVCGGVAFLGLLGYLAVVSAAQPADRVAHFGRRRRQLMKKASKVDDPTLVQLEDFQDEPALAALLERWQRDRELADTVDAEALPDMTASAGMSEEEKLHLEELGERMEQIGEEINSLALNAALHLSRLGDEAGPLMETMDQFQSQAERIPEVAEELHRVIAGVPAAGHADSFGDTESELAAMASPEATEFPSAPPAEDPSVEEPAKKLKPARMSPVPTRRKKQEAPPVEDAAIPAAAATEIPVAPAPTPEGQSEDELSALHDEIFQRTPPAPPAAPVETMQEEPVFDLSEFGAEEVSEKQDAAPQGPQVYDLNEFGAVEL